MGRLDRPTIVPPEPDDELRRLVTRYRLGQAAVVGFFVGVLGGTVLLFLLS